MRPRFLLRWSVRDLRRRWLQVVAVALVIAIGTGVYAALGSTAAWRQESNDESYERLEMYDVRVRVAEGADAPGGALLDALASLPDQTIVETAEERLVLPTQVDASTADQTILVPGRIVGMDVRDGGPHVNDVEVVRGRALGASEGDESVVVLEQNFASHYDLPAEGTVRVAGGRTARYVGHVFAPEYFMVLAEDGAFFAEANFGVLFAPLATAQALTGHPDRVNDLVLRLRAGADVDAAMASVQATFRSALPDLAVTVTDRWDEASYQMLYDDIESDQQLWNVFAGLILFGAALGAFNLANRMVDAQRREIGIGMALGERPWQLALRPLLVGVEIALLGAMLGVAVGILVVAALRPVYTSILPLPVWHTAIQWPTFARGAVLGFVIPLVATAWPVVRAVRVMPVDAIATAHRPGAGGLARLARRLPRPIGALRRMPFGNVLRTPRRTLLTVLGIGAALSTLVALLGMVDSFLATAARGERELLQDQPDRTLVVLDGFVAEGGPEVGHILDAPSVGRADAVLRLPATVGGIEVLLEVADMQSEIWVPTIVERGKEDSMSGLVLARKAMDDLGLRVGDRALVEHPALTDAGIEMVTTAIPVSGVHPGPMRVNAFLDRGHLARFGAEGLANTLYVLPAAGSTTADLQRDLFGLDGVASVQPIAVATRMMGTAFDEFNAVFRAVGAFILFLVLLIAYNASSINADERARERATLFAFGLPARRIVTLEVAESFLLGCLATVVGLGGGLAVVGWVMTTTAARTMPDMGFDVAISSGTVAVVGVLGVAAVALAPLLTFRRLRRMDVPGTLRVVE